MFRVPLALAAILCTLPVAFTQDRAIALYPDLVTNVLLSTQAVVTECPPGVLDGLRATWPEVQLACATVDSSERLVRTFVDAELASWPLEVNLPWNRDDTLVSRVVTTDGLEYVFSIISTGSYDSFILLEWLPVPE